MGRILVAAAVGGGREPQHGGRVGRAAPHPGGDRHALDDRDALRRGVPARRRAVGRERASGEVLPSTPAQTSSSTAPRGGLQRDIVGERERLHERDERVVAVARAGGRRTAHRLTLPGAAQRQPVIARAPGAARGTRPGASCSARASAGRPICSSAARARSRMSRGAPGASASERGERLAPVREGVPDQRPQRGLGGGAGALEPDQDGVHVRHGMEDGTGHGPQDAHRARQLGQHGGHAVGGGAGSRGEPLAHLLLHHRHPGGDLGQLGHGAQEHRGRHAVGQVGDDLRGRRVERVAGRAGRRRRSAASCWDADPAHRAARARGCGRARRRARARRAPRGTRTARRARRPPRARRRAASSCAARAITSEQVGVDQEVLAEVALGPDAERRETAQARLRGQLAHQPKRRALLSCTRRLELRVGEPAALGDEARRVDDEGRLVAVLAHRLGRQVGRVRLHQQPLERRLLGGVGELARLGIGDVAGERDPPAVVGALGEAVGHREAVQHDLAAPPPSRASVAIVSSSAARVWITSGLPSSRASSMCAWNARSWSARGA